RSAVRPPPCRCMSVRVSGAPRSARRSFSSRRWLPWRRAARRRDDVLLRGPLSGELLGTEALADRARTVARAQHGGARRVPGTRLLERLDATRQLLSASHARIAVAAARGDVGPAGDWLLDNFYVVQDHIIEVRENLPRGYYRELPVLLSGPLTGYPRV